MLPVVICEKDETARARWVNVVDDLIHTEYPALRFEILPGAERELRKALEQESGIMLVILAVSGAALGGIDGCVERFQEIMARNRDNYAMLVLEDSCHLDTVLSHCLRPAGILLAPPQEPLMRASLKRVLSDYVSLNIGEDDEHYMVVNTGRAMQRISYQDILYLEAQNKLLNICTGRRVLTVRASLNEVERSLPEGFIRCHRSYIVNRAYIEKLSLPEMTLQLTSRETLPISRSYKGVFKGFKEKGWD